jgi:hypothetical protein
MGASAWLEATEVEVDPGTEAAVEMRVRNTGPVMDEFSFAPVGMAQGWIFVEPSIVSLFPGAEEQVQVHFRPPRLHTTLAGASPFAVKVVPREDPESTSVVEGTLHVTPFEELGVDLVPTTSRGHRAGAHDLLVRNTGNAAVPLRLGGVDPKDQLRFDFNPSTLLVEPGTAQHCQVRVRPRQSFWSGEPRTWPFQLILDEEGGGEPRIVPGAMLQEPVAPAWFGRAVIGTALALLALILFWFLVLKPTVEDTARDAVRDELAPIETALVAAGITLPPTTVAGGTVPPPAATTTTISPLGDPVEFRLSLSTPEYDVPSGQTLYVTDLVLQNPDSNTGRITVAIDGQPVFDSALDFFRDLDRHFVSPLPAPAGAKVTTTVVCTGPPGGQCTAAATFGAFLKAIQ